MEGRSHWGGLERLERLERRGRVDDWNEGDAGGVMVVSSSKEQQIR